MKTFRLVFMILIMSGLIFQGRAHVCWDDLEFKQFSTPEGLPNSMVHQVYQDRDGIFGFLLSMDCFVMMVTRYVPINQIFIPLVFWLIIMCFVWKKIILTGFGLGLTRESVCLINGQGRCKNFYWMESANNG